MREAIFCEDNLGLVSRKIMTWQELEKLVLQLPSLRSHLADVEGKERSHDYSGLQPSEVQP